MCPFFCLNFSGNCLTKHCKKAMSKFVLTMLEFLENQAKLSVYDLMQ